MTKPLTIDLPDSVAAEAEKIAQAAGENLATFAARAIAFEVERERTETFFTERRARANIARAMEILNRNGGQPPAPDDVLPDGYARPR